MRTKPRTCEWCRREFPTTRLFKSHIFDGCCAGIRRGTHIACSSCKDWLADLAAVASRAVKGGRP